MRAFILTLALWAAAGGAAEAQDCTNSVYNSYQCSDGSRLTPTWNGGYQTGGGTTWNRAPLDNGWNSNNGGTIRQNPYGNVTTGGGSTWSQTPLDSGIRSSTGRTCTRGLLDNIICR